MTGTIMFQILPLILTDKFYVYKYFNIALRIILSIMGTIKTNNSVLYTETELRLKQ